VAEEVTSLGRGRYRLSGDEGHAVAYAAPTPTATWVFVDGQVYVVPADAGGGERPSAARVDDTALAAPMPATVVAVHVAPGQAVRRGEVLVVLEAMKMELTIPAPRDGRIISVSCRAGDLVQPGVPLLAAEWSASDTE
jgi:biotin carboxyl carrier protein